MLSDIDESSVLVTGGNGQLATELKPLLPHAVYADLDKLNITNEKAVFDFVHEKCIKYIVNCAAYTAVDQAEDDERYAYMVNALGPGILAKTNCRLIHISTDYVFSGSSSTPYYPSDIAEPISVYGKTKLAGEKAVMDNSDNAVIIRTAGLYSSHGNNFLKTILKLGMENPVIRVVDDQIGTTTFAGDLAKAIVKILPQVGPSVKGIYHYTNEGVCSWYDFAHVSISERNIQCKVIPIPSSEYPTKARRPHYSVLDKTLIKNTFNIEISHWMESLKKCLKQF